MPPPHINQFKKQINRTLFCCFALLALQSNTATIHYQATDLTDTTMGEDLWRYSYSVSDHIFSMDTDFSIFFNHALYSDLQNPVPSVNPDWDILLIQPNSLTLDNGIYDALALTSLPSLATVFSVDFVWLGIDLPNSQPFEIYDAGFNVIISDNTTTSVPTPSVLLFLSGGFILLSGIRKRRIPPFGTLIDHKEKLA